MTPSLTPLTCTQCGGAVPLAAGERTRCPYCASVVEIPAAYRELRDTERELDAGRREGHELARALAKVPSAPVRMLAMFDSAWFLWFGLGVWIIVGVIVGVVIPPIIGGWFGINTVDVLDERTQGWISMVLPVGTFALGLLGAGWARKRAIVRGGLQVALAARGPERTGGPERCRQCGAALMIRADDHAVSCPYCRTDNLVNMPPGWIDGMRRQSKALGRELAAAREQWAEQRRELRTSLVVRAFVGIVLVAIPTTCVLGAGGHPTGTTPIDYAAGKPGELPSWSEHRSRSVPAPGFCTPETVAFTGFSTRAEDCDDRGCVFHRLVPLERGEVLRVVSADIPADSDVALQIHERTFLDDRWSSVATATLDDARPPELSAPTAAWYRLAFWVPGARGGDVVRACVERRA